MHPDIDRTAEFRRLLRGTLMALATCAALVALCYFLVDRPVAFFVERRGRQPFWEWLTIPPPIAQQWAPLILAGLMVRRAFGSFRHWERALLAAAVAIVLADQFRESIAIVSGRDWPETWINNNPSLIRDRAFGFHPFHYDGNYGSFPSGHTARTAAMAAVAWIAWPKWRCAAIAATGAVGAGLVAMNYHFVGDVIAGAFVGSIVGAYTARCCGVAGRAEVAPPVA